MKIIDIKMNPVYNSFTGEKVNLLRVSCKCGHAMNFLSNHSAICGYCGRRVYPTKKCEFKEKIEMEMRKKKNE